MDTIELNDIWNLRQVLEYHHDREGFGITSRRFVILNKLYFKWFFWWTRSLTIQQKHFRIRIRAMNIFTIDEIWDYYCHPSLLGLKARSLSQIGHLFWCEQKEFVDYLQADRLIYYDYICNFWYQLNANIVKERRPV